MIFIKILNVIRIRIIRIRIEFTQQYNKNNDNLKKLQTAVKDIQVSHVRVKIFHITVKIAYCRRLISDLSDKGNRQLSYIIIIALKFWT